MNRLRRWLAGALLIVCAQAQTARGVVRPPSQYVFLFSCDDLDDIHHEQVLHALQQELAISLSDVPVKSLLVLKDPDRRLVTEQGGEVLEVKLLKSGDDWNMKLEVDSRLHPAKPYPVMTGKTKISATDMVRISATREKIVRKISEHHKQCHLDQGACP